MLTLIRYGNSRRLGTITEKGTSKKFSDTKMMFKENN